MIEIQSGTLLEHCRFAIYIEANAQEKSRCRFERPLNTAFEEPKITPFPVLQNRLNPGLVLKTSLHEIFSLHCTDV